ncbi:uncharacterized protein [Temnothorax longispinosus]|uniref:uncharacterized protein n=1 Tax=Temnothorax longispinosus TaxID=300112 RepID=UPI003A98D65E
MEVKHISDEAAQDISDSKTIPEKEQTNTVKSPAFPETDIIAYEDTSITPELKAEADRLARKLQQVSLDPIRSIMESDPNAALETMMEDGEPSSGSLFMMKTPIAKTPQLPTPSRIPRLEDVKIARWYPHQSDQSFEGKMTSVYLNHLKRAKISESESFLNLQAAEKLSRHIGCSRTVLLWTTLNPILTQIGNLRLPEIASDIAGYLYDDPDSVFPYLKCFNRVKTLLVNPAEKFATLEDRITQMILLMESTISAAENYQEESLKFATQVSNVSANLAGFQEVFEKTIIKVKKLDLLPDTSSPGSSGISIPSSAPRHQGQ